MGLTWISMWRGSSTNFSTNMRPSPKADCASLDARWYASCSSSSLDKPTARHLSVIYLSTPPQAGPTPLPTPTISTSLGEGPPGHGNTSCCCAARACAGCGRKSVYRCGAAAECPPLRDRQVCGTFLVCCHHCDTDHGPHPGPVLPHLACCRAEGPRQRAHSQPHVHMESDVYVHEQMHTVSGLQSGS